MIIIGYSSYSVIMIRSIADPPVDENDPETVEDFVSYLKREQYGDTPILKGNSYDAATGQINTQKEVWLAKTLTPNHLSYYARYDSDLEHWDYQVRYMYRSILIGILSDVFQIYIQVGNLVLKKKIP